MSNAKAIGSLLSEHLTYIVGLEAEPYNLGWGVDEINLVIESKTSKGIVISQFADNKYIHSVQ